MRIEGSVIVAAPRQAVWDALQDPAVLARTLPGCDAFEEVGPDAYRATITAGIASIKGTYLGDVALSDRVAPEQYRLHASGSGAPGTVSADALVTLDEVDGGTRIGYSADAVVGGMIGGVGQRMISGVAKRMAGQFFAAVERDILGTVGPSSEVGGRSPVPVDPAPSPGPLSTSSSARARGQDLGGTSGGERTSSTPSARSRTGELAVAAILGGLLVLAGVVAGSVLG
jgi:carbon monoxide dehydrogenase subunit G